MTKQQTVYNPALKYQVLTGDCVKVMESLPAGVFNALVTDPPYGIGKRLTSGGKTNGWTGLVGSGAEKWDIAPPKSTFDRLLSFRVPTIIWGGNFFNLPPCHQPLCWDKVRPNQKNAGEWEYAWTSFVGRARMFRHCGNGGFILQEPKVHPVQKPLPLMRWCMYFLPKRAIVLDPFCGSGSTGVACKQLGIPFIGIELDPKWADIARRRLAETKEPWIAPPKKIIPPKRNPT